jgi:hypothetical protein
MPVFCDAPLEQAPGQPLWYAGGPLAQAPAAGPSQRLGGLLLKYHHSFDRYFATPPAERQRLMRADFEALLASRLEDAERTGMSPGYVVMYTHPCRTVTAAFPSNFTTGQNPPRGEWRPAPLRPQGEVAALLRDFDAFLEWIGELRREEHVVLSGYRELYERCQQPSERAMPLHQITELARALSVDHAPICARMVGGYLASPAEQFGALAWVVNHLVARNHLPREVPVRWLLGPVDADRPIGAAGDRRARQAGTITIQEGQELASAAYERCAQEGAVPASVRGIGPGRMLRLMARLVVGAAGPARGTTLRVPRGGDETDLSRRDDVQRLRFQGTWSIFPPEFAGGRLIAQAHWQTWAAKPAL